MPDGWQKPSGAPALINGEVHVWRFDLDRPRDHMRGLEPWLAADEMQRAIRFRGALLRDRYVAGRGMLRYLLGRYLDRGPSDLRFRYGKSGKPGLDGAEAAASLLQFNLAHSGRWALLAVATGRALGVDIEEIRPMPEGERIVSQNFSRAEVAEFFSLPGELRLMAFFSGWTRKEAVVKAIGGGLSVSLDSFDVTLSPSAPPRLLRLGSDSGAMVGWSLYHLDPAPGYVGALAIEGSGHRLRFFEAPGPEALFGG